MPSIQLILVCTPSKFVNNDRFYITFLFQYVSVLLQNKNWKVLPEVVFVPFARQMMVYIGNNLMPSFPLLSSAPWKTFEAMLMLSPIQPWQPSTRRRRLKWVWSLMTKVVPVPPTWETCLTWSLAYILCTTWALWLPTIQDHSLQRQVGIGWQP